jgi:spermidine synthase
MIYPSMDKNTSKSKQDLSPPRLTILLVSAMALSYEILLMRLFSIVQYHHFAYMVISLALLGYGASGTFLVFFRQKLLRRFPMAFITNILLFGITIVACYLGGQHLLFNPDEMLWDNREWLKLFALYLVLALPFFFAANCIALAFSRYRQRISEIYAADLFGAGLGSFFVIGLLFLFFPNKLLLFLGSMVFVIGTVAWLELRLQPRWLAFQFIGAAAVFLLLPSAWTDLAVSPYKGLSQQMRIKGSRIVEEKSSPLALLTVVESPLVPLRYAPGLSLTADSEPPAQIGIFIDSDSMNVITRFPEDIEDLAYLDKLTTALPYHLRQAQDVLILGAGAGSDILQALYFKTVNVDAVELNPQVVQLVRERPEFSGNLFDRKNVQVHMGEARSFISGSSKKFDLIQLPMLDSFNSSAAGLYALNENYLYTVEALQEYINHLAPAGYLSMSRWVKLPPRDTLKLFATAVEALKRSGIEDAEKHLVLIRSWQSASLLLKRAPFSMEEISLAKKFCQERLFDLVYYPGMVRLEANRFNILREPYFYDGTVSLLKKDSGRFVARYKFNINPSTDDRPYFSNYFKWKSLPEILKLRGQGGMVLLESGYFILVITLFQAVAASLILVLLPVIAGPYVPVPEANWSRPRIVAYFFAIGLGFLFLEIVFIQKFILYLGHPLYAAAVVLSVFLVFAGMGSKYAQAKRVHVIGLFTVILGLGIADLLAANFLFDAVNWLPVSMKILVAVVMLGPLAFSMGMPFPLALTEVGADAPDLIPLAWAVNGCASVIAAVLATLLAIHFGFTAVVLTALAFYGFAGALFPAGFKLKGAGNARHKV